MDPQGADSGFFDIPVDHLFAAPVIIDYLARLDYPELTLACPT